MRKFFIITAICLASVTTFGQTKFGLRFAPNLSTIRLTNEIIDTTVTKNGAGVRFSIGPTLDFGLSDHVSFSTGVWFTSKRASINWNSDDVSVAPTNDTISDSPVFGLHYLQIPVSIKYFTGEITDGMKLYFQLGGTVEFNITEKLSGSDFELQQKKNYYTNNEVAKLFEAGAYFGLGVEKEVGSSNVLFGGIAYNRGLTNILTKKFFLNNKELNLGTQIISLEMGIKF